MANRALSPLNSLTHLLTHLISAVEQAAPEWLYSCVESRRCDLICTSSRLVYLVCCVCALSNPGRSLLFTPHAWTNSGKIGMDRTQENRKSILDN